MRTFLVFLAAAAFLAPQLVFAASSNLPAAPADTGWQFNRAGKNVNFGSEVGKEASYDENDLVNIYRLRKGELTSLEETTDKVKKDDLVIWNTFEGIAGKKFIGDYLLAYGTYKDAKDPTLAFVKKLDSKPNTWLLAVNANAVDARNQKWTRDMAITLVHEYAHILTLNNSQMKPKSQVERTCRKTGDTFFQSRSGCTKEQSYMNGFVKAFWNAKDIAAASAASAAEKTGTFYQDHKESFVTPYAATSPAEDIAESFADFVLQQKPAGQTIREQKIRFFYSYPELIELRTSIRASIGSFFI